MTGESILADATGTRVTTTGGEVTAIRREDVLINSLEHARRVAKVCEEFRGRDTVILDMTQVSALFDYFVITSANSRRQMHAIAETCDDALEEIGTDRLSREGYDSEWICQDYGDVVLHVFSPDAREIYDLENLWGDTTQVDLDS